MPVLENMFKSTIFACISTRVADVLAGNVQSKILVAAEPSEIALLYLAEANGRWRVITLPLFLGHRYDSDRHPSRSRILSHSRRP